MDGKPIMDPSNSNTKQILYDERISGRSHRLSIRLYYILLLFIFIWSEYFLATTLIGDGSGMIYLTSIYLTIIFVALGIISVSIELIVIGPIQILSDRIVSPNRNYLDLIMNRQTFVLFDDIQLIEINDRGPIKIKLIRKKNRDILIGRHSIINLNAFLNSIPEQYKEKINVQKLL